MTAQDSPFHSGERMIQLRTGSPEAIEARGARQIRTRIEGPEREWLARQRIAFVGVLTEDGYPRCLTAAGEPGWLHAPAAGRVALDWTRAAHHPVTGPPGVGEAISVLVLDHASGNRLRINGMVERERSGRTLIRVEQTHRAAFRYVHARVTRHPGVAAVTGTDGAVQSCLTSEMSALLHDADTMLVTSRHSDQRLAGKHGLDLSHRGGLPGFVVALNAQTVVWPEYRGNGFFNTLGNLILDSRCAVLAVSSEHNVALHLRGRGEVLWNDRELAVSVGADRGVRLRIEEASLVPGVLSAHYRLTHYAPALAAVPPVTGPHPRWRRLRVTAKSAETADAVSVHLADPAGRPLRPFRGGQHVRIRLAAGNQELAPERNYSLSQYAPVPETYRLTIGRRRDGTGSVSEYAHHRLDVGEELLVSEPMGAFTLPQPLHRPLVLVSAGIGITPMIALAQELAQQAPEHPLWFVHGTRNGASRVFRQECQALRGALPNARWHVRFSRPRWEDVLGRDYDGPGRVGLDTLKAILPFDAFDFFLCGPDRFLIELSNGLRALHVPATQIHLESFGITDAADTTALAPGQILPVSRQVRFARSGIQVTWTPDSGSLLALAQRSGIAAPCSCRTGMCGTCSQRIRSGQVGYMRQITAQPEAGCALLCSCVPASDLEIDL